MNVLLFVVDFGDLGVGSIVIPAFTSAGSQVCNEFAIAGDVDNLLEDEEQFPLYIVSFVTVGFPTLAPSVQLELPCDNATVIIPASDNLGKTLRSLPCTQALPLCM